MNGDICCIEYISCNLIDNFPVFIENINFMINGACKVLLIFFNVIIFFLAPAKDKCLSYESKYVTEHRGKRKATWSK